MYDMYVVIYDMLVYTQRAIGATGSVYAPGRKTDSTLVQQTKESKGTAAHVNRVVGWKTVHLVRDYSYTCQES